MPNKRDRSKATNRSIPFLLIVLFATAIQLHAQAKPTAARAYGLSAFATGGLVNNDYGSRSFSFAGGGDVAFYPHFLRFLDPSIEARFMHAGGAAVTENSFQGGLKLTKNYGRFHPYGTLMVGYAIINFNNPASSAYTYDNATLLVPGGGVDIDLIGPFALKADFQGQFWVDIGRGYTGLTPQFYTVGVTYTIPAKAFRSER